MATVKKKEKRVLKPKIFPCPLCKKKFSEKGGVKQHMYIHSDEKLFSCEKCNRSYKTPKYLQRHMTKTHTPPTRHECSDCGKKFHYKSGLDHHRLTHTNERPFKCKWCKKGFNSTYTLSTHIRIHTNSKPYKCSYCEYACRDGSTLRKHEERHKGIVHRYKCKICDKQFASKTVLRYHVNEVHLNIDTKVLPCETCGNAFRDQPSLTLHINTVHKRLYTEECSICGFLVKSKHNMKVHLRSHVDLRPYTCSFDGCGKSFKGAGDLKKHEIIHYPDKHFPCDVCGRRFSRLHRLETHKLQHVAKKKTVECDYCGVRFYNKKYLANHITRKHLHREEYICDVCNFVSGNKPGLITHIKNRHDSEVETKCKICNKVFKKQTYLKLHYWNTHSIKYKIRPRKPRPNKDVVIKEEKMDDYLEMRVKQELMSESDQETEYSKNVQAEDLQKLFVGNKHELEPNIESFFDLQLLDRNDIPAKPPDPRLDLETEKTLQKKIKKIVKKSKRLKEKRELEKARKTYNRRMETFLQKETKSSESEHEDMNNESEISEVPKSICVKDQNGKLIFNVHQCYVCFALFRTKEKLLDHCQEHFDVCNTTTLRKCPLCDHVSKVSLKTHLLKKHNLKVNLRTGNIEDKKESDDGSRYHYNFKNKTIKKIDIIPSVKLLNKAAYIKLDKERRENRDKMITKTKLVKKGKEWIVEKESINIENYVIPKISEIDSKEVSKIAGDHYCDRMKKLSVVAKKNGKSILFPCDKCEKICQTLSALKLHYRRHDPNAKPFKPKVWKHKIKTLDHNKNNNNDALDENLRHKIPKPITNKHRCDPNLIKFYESNVRGDNIEFWQFLKIYNRMTKEEIKDFSDLQNRPEFGIQPVNDTEKIDNNTNDSKKNIKIQVRKSRKVFKVQRKILISKKEHDRRNEIKRKMRERALEIT